MRILSSFKDYYDGGAMHGIDATHIYVRKTEDIQVPDVKVRDFTVIGFCGNLYICQVFRRSQASPQKRSLPVKSKTFYGEKSYAYKWEGYSQEKLVKVDKNSYGYKFEKNFYNDLLNNDALKSIFQQYKTPIFLLEENFCKINPMLKDYFFYKIKPLHEAFREIEYYISNILVNDDFKSMQMSDKEKLTSKGFDNWSFKKEKDTRKRKRR